MNSLDFYTDRMEILTWKGGTEEAVVTRRGRTYSPDVVNDIRNMLCHKNCAIPCGELVTRANGDIHIIIARQFNDETTQLQSRRINSYITLQEIAEEYVNHKRVGVKANTIMENVPCYQHDVSTKMQRYDAGLLPETIKRIVVQTSVPIKVLHRVVIDGISYQVNAINTVKYPSCYEVQLGEDTRK